MGGGGWRMGCCEELVGRCRRVVGGRKDGWGVVRGLLI